MTQYLFSCNFCGALVLGRERDRHIEWSHLQDAEYDDDIDRSLYFDTVKIPSDDVQDGAN